MMVFCIEKDFYCIIETKPNYLIKFNFYDAKFIQTLHKWKSF